MGGQQREEESEGLEERGVHAVEQAARLARRSRGTIWLLVAALVVIGIAGVTTSGGLARRGTPVSPAHALGPNQGEALGSASAPVLVEEYADFRCPACARFQREVGPTIRQLAQQGRIRFVFHHDATAGREAALAASAATCAGDAGRFWPYHDALYARQDRQGAGALTVEQLIALGRQVGASGPIFASCVRNGTYDPWVALVTDQAAGRGVTTLPVIFVNGRPTDRASTPAGLRAAVQEAARRG
jgi:protein-disulfide isomerase